MHDAKVFAEQFTVYNYDRRGHGDSGNTLPYAVEREVEDIEAIIDAAGGSAYVYGHSSGAILALEAAMQLGDKVSKLVMYEPPYANNDVSQNEFKKLIQRLSKLLNSGKNVETMHLFLTDGIGIPEEVIIDMRQLPHWEKMIELAPTVVYDTILASKLVHFEQASQLTTPTHIIVGEESPALWHEIASKLGRIILNAKYSKLAGQDHEVDPEVLLPVLSNFLKQ